MWMADKELNLSYTKEGVPILYANKDNSGNGDFAVRFTVTPAKQHISVTLSSISIPTLLLRLYKHNNKKKKIHNV